MKLKKTKVIICFFFGGSFFIFSLMGILLIITRIDFAIFITLYIFLLTSIIFFIPGILLIKEYVVSHRLLLLWFFIIATMSWMGLYIGLVGYFTTEGDFWEPFFSFLGLGLFLSILLGFFCTLFFEMEYF